MEIAYGIEDMYAQIGKLIMEREMLVRRVAELEAKVKETENAGT